MFKIKDMTIKINLPDDPYSRAETLFTQPIYNFRGPYGRGETLEWRFINVARTDEIVGDYVIHYDELRKSLDDATKTSKNLGLLSLGIALFSLSLTIYFEWIKGKGGT